MNSTIIWEVLTFIGISTEYNKKFIQFPVFKCFKNKHFSLSPEKPQTIGRLHLNHAPRVWNLEVDLAIKWEYDFI